MKRQNTVLNRKGDTSIVEKQASILKPTLAHQIETKSEIPFKLLVCIYGIILVVGTFFLRGTIGINLADEGYVWYGAQRTLLGEIPLRDFQSYEPGRYYWIAGCMKLLGSNGLYAFRLAVTFFQAIGLSIAVLLIAESKTSKLNVLLAGPIALLWMITPFRAFEDTISVFLVAAVFLLLNSPNRRSGLLSGLILGLSVLFGKNHALYGLVALSMAFGLTLLAHKKRNILSILMSFGIGILLGSLPLIALIIFAPGFLDSFIDSIAIYFHFGSTNLPLPVPFPWKTDFSSPRLDIILRDLSFGSFFVLLPLFGIVGAFLILFRGRSLVLRAPVFLASVLVSIPYTHYAFSRADPEHMSSSIHAFLIGMLTLPGTIAVGYRLVVSLILLGLSWAGIRNYNPYFQPTPDWVKYRIGNHEYLISRENQAYLETFSKAADLAGPGGRIFVAPHWPAAYPILGQKTQTWQNFFTISWPKHVQEQEAQRLAADPPRVAVIRDYPLDGRPEFYFRNTNPLIWKYLTENYRLYSMENIPSDIKIFISNDIAQP